MLAGCGAGLLPAVHSEAERLSVARTLAAKGQVRVAIDLLKLYIGENGGSAEVDEAIYLLGECYLRTKEWSSADAEFERLLRDYPESDSSGSAAFRRGEALFGQARPQDFDQDNAVKALDQWRSYVQGYPGHWLNAEAGRRIEMVRRRLGGKLLDTGRLYLKLKLPQPARVYFERVEREYGDTDLFPEARLGEALSDALAGRRPEAIATLKEIEERYPGQPIARRAAREHSHLER